MMEGGQSSTEERVIIMEALSILSPTRLSDLINSLSSLFHRHRLRLSSLLSSPILFSLSLHRLRSLSLHQKSLLIARHLLFLLSHLIHFIHPKSAATPPPTAAMKLRDLDAVLLLLLLCELRKEDPASLEAPPSRWRVILSDHFARAMLRISGMGVSNGDVLIKYIEVVGKCKKCVRAMGLFNRDGEKGNAEVAASTAAVVALPSVEVNGNGRGECVICREEMQEGRDVCELPCEHSFHWLCILPWLKKRNTCPCCRFRLPTDDVVGEIQRLWEVLVKMAGNNS